MRKNLWEENYEPKNFSFSAQYLERKQELLRIASWFRKMKAKDPNCM